MYDNMWAWYPHNRSVAGGAFIGVVTVQEIAVHPCGYQRCLIRDVGICVGAAITGGPPVVGFWLRPNAGVDGGKILKFNWAPTTGLTAGNIHIKRGVNIELIPGQDLVAEVDVGAAAGTIGISLAIDMLNNPPGNYPNMKAAIQ